MRQLFERIATRLRVWRMTLALDEDHLALARLKRLPVNDIGDIMLRVELSTVIVAGEEALAKLKERA